MSIEDFKVGLMDYYQGELQGEVVMEMFLNHFTEPAQQAKIAALLQLETETKARLRPALMELGLPLTAQEESLKEAQVIAGIVAELDWDQAMAAMCEQLPGVVQRYKEIADTAPREYLELAESMVEHEQSLLDFAKLELSGDKSRSLDAVTAQLHFKLPDRLY